MFKKNLLSLLLLVPSLSLIAGKKVMVINASSKTIEVFQECENQDCEAMHDEVIPPNQRAEVVYNWHGDFPIVRITAQPNGDPDVYIRAESVDFEHPADFSTIHVSDNPANADAVIARFE